MDNDYLALESGKQRAGRLALDYYKHQGWKPKSIAAVVVCVALTCVAAAMYAGRGQANFSPGPLSAAHAAWDQKCKACHTGLGSVGEQSAQTDVAAASCQQCHQMPAHHANEQLSATSPSPNCVGCHLEHRGREASLTRVDDHQCTNCHANLKDHVKPSVASDIPGEPLADRVATFDLDTHPQFRSTQRDLGNIAFNHQQHLSPGIAFQDDGSAAIFDPRTFDSLPAADKHRYQKYLAADGKVRLTCDACHELSTRNSSRVATSVNHSDQYAAISFDRHCQACHGLTDLSTKVDLKDDSLPLVAIPHHLQSDGLEKLIRGLAIASLAKQQPEVDLRAVRPLPGDDDAAPAAAGNAPLQIERAVDRAKTFLASAGGCGKCHGDASAKATLPLSETGFPEVPPASTPHAWFQHARFNHAAHGAMDCAECHGVSDGAKTKPVQQSSLRSDVLIPGPETCVRCHAADGAMSVKPTDARSSSAGWGGAGTHCIECHAYHRGEMNHNRQGSQSADVFMSNGEQAAPMQRSPAQGNANRTGKPLKQR